MKLKEFARDLTTPMIPGLDVRPFAGETDAGVVALYVPSSDAGPFRASGSVEAHAKDRYFLRTARGSDVMPHQILAAMFGRTPAPKLHLRVSFEPSRVGKPAPRGSLLMQLENHGPGVARRASLRFRVQEMTSGAIVPFEFHNAWHSRVAMSTRNRDARQQGIARVVNETELLYPDEILRVNDAEVSAGRYRVSIRIDAEGAFPIEHEGEVDLLEIGDAAWFPALTTDEHR
jgi:hypothetical protein